MQDKNASGSNGQENSLPFFTRFLEGQHNLERSAATTKFPSDLDEFMTMKYPSDDDDNPPPIDDWVMKADDASQLGPPTTLKYPSDRDEWDFI